MPSSTAGGKWILWDKDGKRFERWPIDGRGMVDSGEFFHEPPDGEAPTGATPEERGLVEGASDPLVLGRGREQRSRAKEQEANAAPMSEQPKASPEKPKRTRKRAPRKKG